MVALSTSLPVAILSAVVCYALYRLGRQSKEHTESVVALARAIGDALGKSEDTTQRLATNLSVLKGVDPHVAEPSEFAPTGVSWKTLERTKAAVDMDKLNQMRTRLFTIEQAREIFKSKGQDEKADSYLPEIRSLRERIASEGVDA